MLHHGVEVSPTGFDAVRVFNEKGTDRFAIGVDVNDGYKFKVSLGGALGSNDFVTIDTAGNVGINDSTPSYPLEAVGAAPGLHVAEFRQTHASGYTRIRMQTPDSRFLYVGIGNASAAGWVGRGHLITDPNTPISIGANYRPEQLFLSTGDNVGFGTQDPTELVDIDSDAIRLRDPQTPATAGAVGTTGMICWSTGHIYVAVGTNEWERAALASW